jgi:activator of HSP90 ATPase
MQTKNIKQMTVLDCSPHEAYNAWLDSKTHGEMINAKAKIDPKIGGAFDIWDGYLIGKTTELHPTTFKIIQDWRDDSTDWPKDYYSKITLQFVPSKNQTKLRFWQSGIPEQHAQSIADGWKEYYWEPMQKYFKKSS